jgi:hypothetical protein
MHKLNMMFIRMVAGNSRLIVEAYTLHYLIGTSNYQGLHL